MEISQPTHLGGELVNLEWEDLNPHELIVAACGSHIKARAILPLVSEQIEAAYMQGDRHAGADYEYARWILRQVAKLKPRQL